MDRFSGVVSAAVICLAGGMALASSDAAWDDFRAKVDASCRALVEAPDDAAIAVEVNPFGSERFGAAMVSVTYPTGGEDRMICIMDKHSGAAEMTAPFTPDEQAMDQDTLARP